MTGDDVIEEAIRILLGGSREEMNLLNQDVALVAGAINLQFDLGGIKAGSQVSIGNEVLRVWEVEDTSKSATVARAVLGSTQEEHHVGDYVYVNPRFPRFAVVKAMNDELSSLSSPSSGLYQVKSDEFTFSSAVSDYELPADTTEVYDLYADSPGPSQAWVRVPNWQWNPNANPGDFTTGKSIRIPNAFQGRTVRVVYKSAFGQIADTTNDIEDEAGMPTEMHDILTLGVLMRLGPSREIKRNFTEAQRGDARRAEEVPAGSVTNSFAWVRNQRAARITEERLRLERSYPPRHPAR